MDNYMDASSPKFRKTPMASSPDLITGISAINSRKEMTPEGIKQDQSQA